MHLCSSPTPNCSRSVLWTRWRIAGAGRWLVVAAEPVTGIDVTAGDTLAELDEALRAVGIALSFAELKDPVKDTLKQFGLFARLGETDFFPTIGQPSLDISKPMTSTGWTGRSNADVATWHPSAG